jgi:hypothetical protein
MLKKQADDKGRKSDGSTPAQRREADAKALEEKRKRKADAAAAATAQTASGIKTQAPKTRTAVVQGKGKK